MSKRTKLTAWVKEQHGGQLIRKTTMPYVDHVLFVAELAGPAASLTYEIGLCHDLVEKTNVDQPALSTALKRFGYNIDETAHITNAVAELTRADNPGLSKKESRAREDKRLMNSSADAQTVKYADLLYNAQWMIAHKPEKAEKYLTRKLNLIRAMTNGDAELRAYVFIQLTLNEQPG